MEYPTVDIPVTCSILDEISRHVSGLYLLLSLLSFTLNMRSVEMIANDSRVFFFLLDLVMSKAGAARVLVKGRTVISRSILNCWLSYSWTKPLLVKDFCVLVVARSLLQSKAVDTNHRQDNHDGTEKISGAVCAFSSVNLSYYTVRDCCPNRLSTKTTSLNDLLLIFLFSYC